MTLLLQQVIDGLASGAIYATLGLGLVFVYRATGFVNLAQGEMAMFSTYIAWQMTSWGAPLIAAIGATVLVSFIGGFTIEATVIRRFEQSPELTLVIVTVGLFLILNQLAATIWGTTIRDFPHMFPSDVFTIGDLRVPKPALGIMVMLVAELAILAFLFKRTRLGLAMRAVASNRESAAASGIPVSRMLATAWGLAAALGAMAGILVAPKIFLFPSTMLPVLIYAICAVTLGGFDSPGGTVLGALIVGVTENLVGGYVDFIGSDLKIIAPLVIIIIVLLVRPSGLFGQASVERA